MFVTNMILENQNTQNSQAVLILKIYYTLGGLSETQTFVIFTKCYYKERFSDQYSFN